MGDTAVNNVLFCRAQLNVLPLPFFRAVRRLLAVGIWRLGFRVLKSQLVLSEWHVFVCAAPSLAVLLFNSLSTEQQQPSVRLLWRVQIQSCQVSEGINIISVSPCMRAKSILRRSMGHVKKKKSHSLATATNILDHCQQL